MKYLCQVSRRKSAPTELKKMVQQLHAQRQKMRAIRSEVIALNKTHKEALRCINRTRSRLYLANRRMHELERQVGCFSCTEYPLPSLQL